MKCPIVFALLSVISTLYAQEDSNDPPAVGFLQIVNLVSLKSPTYIQVADVKLMNGEAVPTGETSGTLALYADSYPISIRNHGASPAVVNGTIKLENGRTFVLIFYDEIRKQKNGKIKHRLRYALLTSQNKKPKARLSLVSLSQKPTITITIKAGRKKITLKEKAVTEISVKIDETITLSNDSGLIGKIEILDQLHYLAFLYDDLKSGKLALSVIENQKIVYEAPMDFPDDEGEGNGKEKKKGRE